MRIFGLGSVEAPQTLVEGGEGRSTPQWIEPNAPSTLKGPPQGQGTLATIFGLQRTAIAAVMLGALLVGATSAPSPAHAQRSARTTISAAQPSAEAQELKQKVGRLVESRFAGNLDRAFRHYDSDGDRALDRGELERLLTDAGIGNDFTRGLWVSGLIRHFDRAPGAIRNGKVDWQELQAALR